MTVKLALDVFERAALTFVEAFLAAFVLTDLSTAKGAALSGGAAALAVIKAAVATRIGDKDSAALIVTDK